MFTMSEIGSCSDTFSTRNLDHTISMVRSPHRTKRVKVIKASHRLGGSITLMDFTPVIRLQYMTKVN